MPRFMHDFICTGEDAHIFEKFTDVNKNPNPVCPECGALSNFVLINAPKIDLEPFSGAFPGAYDAWNRKRAEKLKQERKQNS